tara:strand:- start:107458 stop:108321 length:864 start_codon:yes stop_codon:yes gene_type:complete
MLRRKGLPGQIVNSLITGATGFLGSHIALFLEELGHSLTIIKRKSSSMERLNHLKKEHLFLDVENGLKDSLAGKEFDYIFHIATNYGKGDQSYEEVYESNVVFPLSAFSEIEKFKTLINFDTTLPVEVNDYAKTKHEFLEKIRSKYPDVRLINLKLEHFFGPKDGKFINYITDSLIKGLPSLELTLGTQVRDFIYYKDILSAIKLILSTEIDGDIPIGSGEERPIKELILSIKKLTNNETTLLEWGKVPYRKSEVMYSVANIEILKNLGWRPQYSFEEGIQEIINNS